MNRRYAIALCAVLLAACGKPVPEERKAYVGEWTAPTMVLVITQAGDVSYKRRKDGVTRSIDAPLKDFTAEGFEVGIGPMRTVFVVSKPPYQDGARWKMVVDGMELTKGD